MIFSVYFLLFMTATVYIVVDTDPQGPSLKRVEWQSTEKDYFKSSIVIKYKKTEVLNAFPQFLHDVM